ncbi:MAG TPA: hypothetical protein VI685_09170 [Candidatus Angelobacter sp.]
MASKSLGAGASAFSAGALLTRAFDGGGGVGSGLGLFSKSGDIFDK